jgi:N-acetylglucosaminyldiphosphoundecaprenol N-acetyl-beta-D-mannosaminyltransferase
MLQENYGGDFVSDLQTFELLHFRAASGYTLRIFKEPDAGMYDAINKGIGRMSGDFWAWLNCDEQYLPGTLSYVAQWFENHPQTDILCGDALLTDGEGRAISYRRIIAPAWHHTRLVHLASLSCASFYSRSVVARGGVFDTAWRSIGDAEWMARLIKAGLKINACGRLLSTFAFTGKNTSESPLASREGLLWRGAPDTPPEWMRKPVIFHHRFLKILAGAYRARSVEYAIHRQGHIGRVLETVHGVSWSWPEVGKLKIDDCSLLIDGQAAGGINKPLTGGRRLDCEAAPRGASGAGAPEFNQQSIINNLTTLPVLGTHLAAITYEDLGCQLLKAVRGGETPLAVDFANTHVVTMRRHDREFAALTKCVDLTVPDGMPLVWVMNARGAELKDRVYGPTFTRKFLESCPAGLTHYLVGGSEECGEKFRERMRELNPSLKFVGSYHGRCSGDGRLEDDEAVLKEIREKRPDFIWVGLGTPKQYAWIHRIKAQIDHGVLLAVGFAFDVNAGTKPDTPEWMQRFGLGWLHRMASEPNRLVGRYLKWNSLFLWYLMRDSCEMGKCKGGKVGR